MTIDELKRRCMWCLPVAVGAPVALLAFWLFWVIDDGAVLDFGAPGDVYLTLDDGKTAATQIRLDDKPKVALRKVIWLRLCSTIEPQFIRVDGIRADLQSHIVTPPAKTGPIEPKARWIENEPRAMRDLMSMTGPAKFWMHVKSTCWGHEIERDTPVYEFEIVP